MKGRFTVPLSPQWPFRLRPLRLLKGVFGLSDGRPALQELTVVGSVALESAAPSTDMPFDDDEPYASGNLVAATYDANGLQRLSSVQLDFQSEPPIVVKADPPNILLNTLATISQSPSEAAAEQPAAVSFNLKVVDDKIVLGGGILRTRLFGQDCELRGGVFSTAAADDLKLKLDFSASGKANAVNVQSVVWEMSGGQSQIDVTGAVPLAATEGASTGPALLTLALGEGSHHWFGADLPAGADTSARVDHRRGVVVLNQTNWQIASVAIVRGLAPTTTSVIGALALAIGDAGAIVIASGQAFAVPIASGVAAFEAVNLVDPVLRHTMLLKPNGSTKKMSSEARIRVTLPLSAQASSIDWPVNVVATPPASTTLPVTMTISATPVWTDNLTMRFQGVELPSETLARDDAAANAPLYLKQPWRTRISVLHEFKEGQLTRWKMETLDEVTLFDLGQLIEQSKIDLGRPSPHPNVQSAAYAFSPRYKDEAKLSASIAAAGVVERGLARAGFPSRVIQNALAAAVAPAQGAVAITGATLVEITIDGQDGGVTLPLPWIVGADQAPVLRIPQRPTGAATSCQVSPMDADPYRDYVSGAAEPIPAAGRSATEIAALLAERFGDAPAPFLVADQAFSTDGDDRPKNVGGGAPAPAAGYTRPVFWRAAAAIVWIANRLDQTPHLTLRAATLLGAPGHRSLGSRLRVVAPADAPLAAPSAQRTLYVVARSVLAAMQVPQADEASPAIRAGDTDRLAMHGYAKTPSPLALLTARPDADDRAPLSDVKARLVGVEAAAVPTALRNRAAWLSSSPSLAWPQPRPPLASAAIALGQESPIQDADHAWSGRTRAVALPRKADHSHSEPIYFAFGRKTLFRRPDRKNDPTVAPPDLALSVSPPRARAPSAAALAQAIQEVSSEAEGLSAYLPGGVEITTTGGRAGVVGVDHFGLIVPGADDAFDPSFARFGRPAHRGPTLVQHSRNPRSSGLPSNSAIDTRRRTYAAQNFVEGSELETFLLTSGAMTLLRYNAVQDGPPPSSEIRGAALIIDPVQAELGPAWDGRLKMSALAPKEASVADLLATLGFRPTRDSRPGEPVDPGARVDLVVGAQRFPFDTMAPTNGGFSLILAKNQLAWAQVALREAEPQTSVRLAFRLAEERAGEIWPIDAARGALARIPLALAETVEPALRRAEARAFSLPLLLARDDGPKLRLPLRTIAFGDPAYDRQLASPTKSVALHSNTREWLLAVDRTEYDLRSTVYFAAGVVSSTLGEPTKFEDTAALSLTFDVSVQPKVTSDQKDPKLRRLQIDGASGTLTLYSGKPVCFLISSLREINEDGTPAGPAALAPGDRLVLSVKRPAPENLTPLVVEATLVDETVLAAPARPMNRVACRADVRRRGGRTERHVCGNFFVCNRSDARRDRVS